GNSHGLYSQSIDSDFDLFFYRDGASELPAVGYNNFFGVEKVITSVGEAVTNSSDQGGWLMLGGVELGEGVRVPQKIEITASSLTGGTLEVWLDDLENEGIRIATLPITSTGDDDQWNTFSSDISDAAGQRDVYLRFSGPANAFTLHTIRFIPDPPITGSKEWFGNREAFVIYPNPFSESLSIDIRENNAEYNIYDLLGRRVEHGKVNTSSNIGSDLHPATYILTIVTQQKS